jgi:drug/metabolite transporter (DMT)-like permease
VPGRPTPEAAQRPRTGPLRLAPGLLGALASLFIFGVAYWAMRYPVSTLGGYTVVFAQKVGDLVALVLLTIILSPRWLVRRKNKADASAEGSPVESSPRGFKRVLLFAAFVVPMAILDTGANIAYTLGITVSLTSIVAVLSSLFSPITVFLAWIFLRERLYRWQWLGVLAIFVGVVLVSL